MNIIVVGGGLVGSTLSEKLSRDGHDVSMIDVDPARLREISDTCDVQVVEGNGATAPVLRRAGIERADLVVATSNQDEVNMLAGLLAADLFGVSRIIVRLRQAGHAESFALLQREHGGERMSINPDSLAVDRIARLLEVPGAVDVVSFLDDELLVAGFRIRTGSDFVGLRVSDMNLLFADAPTLAVAIHRRRGWLVPHGSEVIEVDDLVYFAIARDRVGDVLSLVGIRQDPDKDRRQDVMIAGAGPIGLDLALRLEARAMRTVVIEPDAALAQAASDVLTRAVVIHGRPTDQALLDEEDIDRVSTFVALTPEHETNLVAGFLAKRLGAGRVVALVDNPSLVPLVGEVGIDAIISPRTLVIGMALQYIRGGRIRSVAQLLEDRIEIVEAEATQGSLLTAGNLAEIKLPRGVLVAAIRRGEALLVPRGSDRIEPGDRVLLITTTEDAPKLSDFLAQ